MGNLLQNVLTMHWLQSVGVLVFMIGVFCAAVQWLMLLFYDLSYSPLRQVALRQMCYGPSNPSLWIYLGMALLGVGQLLKWAGQLGLDPLSTVFFIGSVLCGLVSLATLASVGFARLVGNRGPGLLDYGCVPMGMLSVVLAGALGVVQFIRCGELLCR